MSYLTRGSFDAGSVVLPKEKDKIIQEAPTPAETVEKMEPSKHEKKTTRLLWLFVFNICAVAMGHVILLVYTNGVIRTIERRFGLSSSKTGLLNSCNDIIHICLVIFIGYFGQKYNKPRIICVTIMFSAFAGLLMASPHFLFSDYDDSYVQRKHIDIHNNEKPEYTVTTNSSFDITDGFSILPTPVYSVDQVFPTPSPRAASNGNQIHDKQDKDNNIQYCVRRNDNSSDINLEDKICEKLNPNYVHPAFYIFVVAQLISGIGSSGAFTLSMVYVDENAPKHKASIYIGAFMSMFSFAPVSGFMLATLSLKFPENILSSSNVDSSDPSFIGCWWLGYLVGGLYITVCAIPLWFYPAKIGGAKPEPDSEKVNLIENKKSEGFLKQLNGIPKAFVSLISNKLYVVNLLQIICGAYTLYGVFVNLVRYIEIHFNRTAAEGSIIAGGVSAVTGAIGNITGGLLVSKFKFRAIDGIRLVLFSSFVFASGNLILMNLACPQVEMDMNHDPKLDMNTALNDCNKPCVCTTNRRDYRPICASNNISYFSPCIAGCTESINNTFTDCKCLKKTFNQKNTTTPDSEYYEGTARKGYCIPPCNLLVPFAITLFIMAFCNTISRVPATMISFRIVKDEERAFAFGVNSFAINLLGFIPSPLIFGYLIDKSCILWQVTCQTVGACLMFDVARFRYSIFGSGFSVEVINFFLNFTLFLFLRKMALGTAMLSHKPDAISETEVTKNEREKINKSLEDRTNNIEMDECTENGDRTTTKF